MSYGLGYGIKIGDFELLPAKGVEGILWGMTIENILCPITIALCFFQDKFEGYHFAKSLISWTWADCVQIKKIFWLGLPIVLAYSVN